MPERTCEVCGAVFWSPRLAKTCSEECFKKRKAKRNAEYMEEHREELKEYHKTYYQEIIKPVQKKLYARHKQALKKRYEQHKAERNARRREIYAGNGDKVREQNARWREQNRELKRQIDAKYREQHREEINRKARERRKFAELEFIIVEVDGQQIKLYKCPRMELKANKLPCGDRYHCWQDEPCKFIPKNKEPLRYGEHRSCVSWFVKSKTKPTFDELEDEV